MKRMKNVRRVGGLVAFGLACLAGCHHLGHSPPHHGRSSRGGEPTTAVTRAQEADMQIAIGRAAERRGDLDQAMAAYKDALKRDKNRADAYQRLAILHDRRGDFRQSEELYRMALAAGPGNADIYCDMGYSLYLQRRWSESERNLKQALVLRPDLARAHNNLGLVYAHNHRTEEALAEYRKAGNDEAQARGNLALALTLDGRLDEARGQYQKILAANPSATSARARLLELTSLSSQRASSPVAPVRDDRVIPTRAPAPSTPPSFSPKKLSQ